MKHELAIPFSLGLFVRLALLVIVMTILALLLMMSIRPAANPIGWGDERAMYAIEPNGWYIEFWHDEIVTTPAPKISVPGAFRKYGGVFVPAYTSNYLVFKLWRGDTVWAEFPTKKIMHSVRSIVVIPTVEILPLLGAVGALLFVSTLRHSNRYWSRPKAP
jgi:hypothetical protein